MNIFGSNQLRSSALDLFDAPQNLKVPRCIGFGLRVVGRADSLRSLGIAVVEWTPDVSLGSAIGAAAAMQRRRRSVAAR